ncbi:ABC transporter ATP-binding protein [Hoeflea sp. EC-HK425]|uniref:ABC transporter ATP-binding protein n=1 Tax=Hoeflea sp. EC-HK425 TaxID=2038388 RepID=UPI0012532D76|nr:ABC transporter ATP-binding protein [Hoeflea sp. EC-HK425]VVT30498.1 sn-glycerol-3-phosphate import ATP-binding protein UgpC [Hoeflea sp. EC-HK425]
MTSVSIRDLTLKFGSLEVLKSLNLDIDEGEFLVLLGPSGCGKSTLLNCIAGLLDISDGQIFIGGNNVTWSEPSERGIGMVFQSYALYPQMTVEGNLAFGLKNARMPKDQIAERIARAAEVLQIEPLLKRKPAQLSGGQRQRVAIGRALVRDVDVFLFDEPLSNLDAKLRAELRVEIKRLHHRLKNTMIYVTHDQIEALTLADRIAIMRNGIIQQLDTPHEIYNRPVNLYVAGFMGSPGMNFIEGDITHHSEAAMNFGSTRIPLERYPFIRSDRPEKAIFGIRPEHVSCGAAAAGEPFTADVEIEVVEPMGADTLVWAVLDGKEFRFRVDGQSPLRAGETARIGFDPAKASIFDMATELRL